ncbi:MAG: YceI family protein [Proteobacteria bacterium]|nr:YceI family protein [Pseudomonadota bacterium]
MTFIRYAFAIVFLLAAMPTYAADWVRSGGEFRFEVTFKGIVWQGTIEQFDIVMSFDRRNFNKNSSLRVSVDLKGVDMYDPEFNAGIAGPDWLDVSNFPQAVFESERIEMSTPGQYLAIGTLTIKGNSETVTVPFHWIGGAQRAFVRGEFVVPRNIFNVGIGDRAIGDRVGLEVKLKFDLSLKRRE